MKKNMSILWMWPLSALFVALTACSPSTPPDEATDDNGPAATATAPASAAEATRTLVVRVQPATEQPFERRLTVQGTLEAKHYANVAARTDGNLDIINVDEGDWVEGDKTVLFQIDPTRVQNALTIAKQNLAVSEASLAVAEASANKVKAEAKKAALDFERYKRLHKESKVTDNEFEMRDVANNQAKAGIEVADAQVDLAERQVRAAEANVTIAQKNLDDATIIAPLSGAVSSRTAEPGEFIASGRVILKIEDPAIVEAAAFIPAQYYPEIEPGKTVFRLTLGGRVVGEHSVTYKAPVIHTTLRTFEIKGLIADAAKEGAVPGLQADMAIVFESRKGLGIPTDAILWRGGTPTVFVAENGHAVSRTVTLGLQNDGRTEILTGLTPGESIVTEGQTQLNAGDALTIQD